MKVVAFTSICEEDACWIDQYLEEADPNPYGFWRDAIETESSAVVVKHDY